jgi:transcriptional regulator with XRE-family HTH domain
MSTTPGIKIVCTHKGCSRRSVARRLCRAHYQVAWKAGELGQHEKLPPREKKHDYTCPDDHKHATATTCYIQHQCRCDACVTDHNARESRRSRLKAYGRFDSGLVDAEPVRAHLLALAEYGIGYKRVAALAGVGVTGVRTIIWGRQEPGRRNGEIPKRVPRNKAEAILAVEPRLEHLGRRQSVKAGPYVRRLKALVALGWSQSKIAAELGIERANFRYIVEYDKAWQAQAHRNRIMMGAGTARAIVDLYDRWSNVRPPERDQREKIAATRSRRYAAERGWPLPMDWEAIDNDFERPTPVRRSAA